MTDCTRAEMRDLLPDLMHGRLDDVTRAMVEEHLATCDACADELALLRAMRSALATPAPRINVAQIVSSIPPSVRQRLPVTVVRGVGGARRNSWRLAAVIALLAAALGGYEVARRSAAESVVAHSTSRDSAGAAPVIAPATQVARAPATIRHAPTAAGRAHDSVVVEPSATAVADAGLGFTGGVSDLADGDVQELLDHLGDIESVPDADVSPPLDLSGEEAR